MPGLGDFAAHKQFMAPNAARGAPPSGGGSGEAAGQEKDSRASASGKLPMMMFGNLAGLAGLGSKIAKPPGTKPDKPSEA